MSIPVLQETLPVRTIPLKHDVEYQKWQFMVKRTLEVIVVAHIALFQAQ